MANIPLTGYWDDASTWVDADVWNDAVWTSDADVLASFEQLVVSLGAGELVAIEQEVQLSVVAQDFLVFTNTTGYKGVGRITDIAQEVVYKATAAKQVIANIEQTIAKSQVGKRLFTLKQRVRDLNAVQARYEPFAIEINIGDAPNIFTIPDDMLTGSITINRAEDSASLMEFTIRLPDGAISDEYLDGSTNKGIELVYTDNASGISEILYTGKIDIPEIDLLGGTITYRCTDNRKAALNSLNADFADNIGYWSDAVFSDPETQADEIEDRLQTVRASLDFNAQGNPIYTSWTPKTVADRTLSGDEIYRRKPTIEMLSRARVVNTVNLELEYQYQRVKQREQKYFWSYGISPTAAPCLYPQIGFPPTKASVLAAIEGTGWAYTDFKPTKRDCGYCADTYTTVKCNEQEGAGYYELYDSAGNPVLDSNGVVKKVWSSGSVRDITYKDVKEVSFKLAKRYAQNISENVAVIVQAQNSIDRYGVVERTEKYGNRVEFDTEIWEGNQDTYLNPASVPVAGGTVSMGTLNNGEYYIDLDNWVDETGTSGKSRWSTMYRCAVEKALTTIAKTHRENTVSVEIPLSVAVGATDSGRKPLIDLSTTLELANNSWITCKGKVGALRYTIDLIDKEATAEIDIKLSRATGNGSYSITLDAHGERPQNRNTRVDTPVDTIVLKRYTHIKETDTIDNSMNGFIIMRNTQQWTNNYGGTRYAFIVDAPCILDEYRDTATYYSTNIKDYAVQIDPLTVSFSK